MFAKVKERLDTAAKPQRPAAGSAGRPMPSIVGPDMVVTGNLSTPGEIHVEGQVDGDVHCARLIIGAGGCIRGTVKAESVKVHGRVDGAIDADEVFLLSGSQVTGDISQGMLEIAPGALFEGAVKRRAQLSRPIAALEPPAPLEREGQFEVVEEAKAPDAPAAPATPPTAKTDAEPVTEPADPDAAGGKPAKTDDAKPDGEKLEGGKAEDDKAGGTRADSAKAETPSKAA